MFKLETGCTENRRRSVLLRESRPPTHNSPYLLLKWESPNACGFFMLYYLSFSLSLPPASPPPPVSAHLRIIWLFISLLLIYLYHQELTTNIHYCPYSILKNIVIAIQFCVYVYVFTHTSTIQPKKIITANSMYCTHPHCHSKQEFRGSSEV